MKRIAIIIAIALTACGVWAFWVSMQMLMGDVLTMDWTLWTVLLVAGSLGMSLGPVLVILAYVQTAKRNYLEIRGVKERQVYTLPLRCQKCNSEVGLHHLEWLGEEEARCPFCGASIPVQRTTSYT